MLGSNIAIGVYVLDMWSVLCVLYMGGGMKYSDMSVCAGHMVSAMCSLLGGGIDRTVLTGHMVSAVCSLCGWWDLI